MTEAEQFLRDALHRVAGGVCAEPRPAAILRQAHRRRNRRRAGLAAASAAIVTSAVPIGASLSSAPLPHSTVPTEGPSVATGPAKVAGPITIDFDKLKQGPAPSVAWYADGVIHDGDKEIPFGGFSYVVGLAKVAGGYAVVADHKGTQSGDHELFLVTPSGERKSLGVGLIMPPAVSADGRQIAWSTFDQHSEDFETMLYVSDTTTGAVVQRRSMGPGEDNLAEPRAFLGSSVIVERATNAASRPVYAWDLGANTVTAWYDGYGLAGLAPDGSAAAVSMATSQDEETCLDLIALPGKQRSWRSCDYDHWGVSFAPDNAHLLSARSATFDHDVTKLRGLKTPSANGPDEPRQLPKLTEEATYVLSAMTGKRVLEIRGQEPLQRVWESADTFLFNAVDGKQEAVVRCTLSGACELASKPRVANDSTFGGAVTLAGAR